MIVKTLIDDNTYKYKTLSNGMTVLMVHNPKFTKSSCAVSVGVGSFNEPADFAGLAHFLEHMLFMGTEKYPEESMFFDFLGQHNGMSNAYTADEMTVYYCEVDSSQIRRMADMFSSFFISPLFMKDSVQREISAVNSEYLNSLNNKEWRVAALLTEFMKDAIPEKTFSCGNSETLKQVDILERVFEFWKTTYSSDLMNLVICGNDALEALEEIAEMFSHIPHLNLMRGLSADTVDIYNVKPKEIFEERFYSKIIQFAPLEDKKELYISIILPHTRSFFKANPLSYIEFLFTTKESGSLLSKLKSERLGFDISLGYDHYNDYTRLRIDIDLTEKGCREHIKVLDMVKSFLSTIKAEESEYSRLKRLENEEFLYKGNESPVDLAEKLCTRLPFYPMENILNFEYLYEEYNPKMIDFLISLISDHSKWMILLADKNGLFESKEKYYNVEYKTIGAFCPQTALTNHFSDQLHLNFNDLFIEKIEFLNSENRYIKTEVFDNGRIFLVFDRKFQVPKSVIFVLLTSPMIKDRLVSLEIFLRLAEDYFNEKYSRILINYHLSLSLHVSSTGIIIKFKGFSSKIAEMAMLFFNTLNGVPLDRFDVIRQEVEDNYLEILSSSPYNRIGEIFCSKIFNSRKSEELLDIVKNIKKTDIRFLDSFYTEVLAVGNIKYNEAFDVFSSIKNGGDKQNVEFDDNFDLAAFETNDKNNNVIAMFYKINGIWPDGLSVEEECDESEDYDDFDTNPHDFNTAVGRLIDQICHERFFKELRTEEELGYIVQTVVKGFLSAEYLVFIVQSEKSVEFLETRINRFVSELQEYIKSMNEDDFEMFKESLVGFYEEPILSLEDFSSHVFSQYKKSRLDLIYNKKMIEIVRTLKKEDLFASKILDSYIRLNSTMK